MFYCVDRDLNDIVSTSSSPAVRPPPLKSHGGCEDHQCFFNASEYLKDFEILHEGETEFLQAHREVCESLLKLFCEDEKYFEVFKILSEPERMISFRVLWRDDEGAIRMNLGWRVQFNSALGPYKGGLRFHPSVNSSILKFLGFEQILKNSLTTLQLGGGKGGSDFDPKGKSDLEIRSFCQSFMTELSKYIGPQTDIPAGDIGVGSREIGFMFGQYRKIQNSFNGTLTGKSIGYGGSLIRAEATGYGAVYFAQKAVQKFGTGLRKESGGSGGGGGERVESSSGIKTESGSGLEGLRCLVSGSGNAAQYCCEKLIELKAKVLTLSDSQGTILFHEGLTKEDLQIIMKAKNVERKRLSQIDLSSISGQATYSEHIQPWFIEGDYDVAFPSATQNEIDEAAMTALLKSDSLKYVVEVANMPTTPEAVSLLKAAGGILCPGKAANAGGVAVSGLEMAQNAALINWDAKTVDLKLQAIMENIFNECVKYGEKYGDGEADLITGANVAGFIRVADAMLEQGLF